MAQCLDSSASLEDANLFSDLAAVSGDMLGERGSEAHLMEPAQRVRPKGELNFFDQKVMQFFFDRKVNSKLVFFQQISSHSSQVLTVL